MTPTKPDEPPEATCTQHAERPLVDQPNARSVLLALMVVIQLSGILTFEYWQRIEAPTVDKRFALHTAIIDREAPYQLRYRILIPAAAEVLAQTLHRVAFHGQPPSGWPYSRRAFQAAYILLNSIAIAGFLLFLHLLIREWWETI